MGDEVAIFRPRPHHTHFALEYVPQLRQFVELGIPQPLAQRRNTRITLSGDPWAIIAVGRFVHGTELENAEWCAVTADSLAPIEHRAGGVTPNQDTR